MRLLLSTLAALCICTASASAMEVGECSAGKFNGSVCTKGEWRALSGDGALIFDGHPPVTDEKLVLTATGWAMTCLGGNPIGRFTSTTTDTEHLRLWKCQQTVPVKADCGTGPEREIVTAETAGELGEQAGVPTNSWSIDASFTCGGLPVSVSGVYVGEYLTRTGDEGSFAVNKQVSKAYLHIGAEFGNQAVSVSHDGVTEGALLNFEQEMRFGPERKGERGGAVNKRVVFRTS